MDRRRPMLCGGMIVFLVVLAMTQPTSHASSSAPPDLFFQNAIEFEEGAAVLDRYTCLDESGELGMLVVDQCWTLADYAAAMSVESLASRGIALPDWLHPDPLQRLVATRTVEPVSGEEPITVLEYFLRIVGEPDSEDPTIPADSQDAEPTGESKHLPDTVALVDPVHSRWYLWTSSGGPMSFTFGDPGDLPVAGDWDCDGIDSPGVLRPSDGRVYLSNRPAHGHDDPVYSLGNPGDVPIAGDFSGDGCDTVSLYRPHEQRFYIFNEVGQHGAGLGTADFFFTFGNPGDKPVVGDWDGDGIDEVGLHRESTGLFYYITTLRAGPADGEFYFGDPDDRFVAGDWGTVNGKDTPAIFRPSDTTFYFRHTLTQGVADSQFVFGEPGWVAIAGNFGLD